MQIEWIRTFLEVAAAGSFVAAADRLHVTQSTVSARMRSLEEQLGRDLFIRRKEGVVLTAAGVQFHPHATAMIRRWEDARRDAAVPAGARTIFRIGGEAGIWNRLLYRWVPWMRANAPDIALRCIASSAADLIQRVVAGEIDVCVVYTPQNRPGLSVELATTERLVLVEARSEGGQGGNGDFVHVNWGGDSGTDYRAAFPEAPSPFVSFDVGTLAFDYLLEQGGRGYFPQSLIAPHLERGRIAVVTDAPALSLPVYLAYQAEGDPVALKPALAGIRSVLP